MSKTLTLRIELGSLMENSHRLTVGPFFYNNTPYFLARVGNLENIILGTCHSKDSQLDAKDTHPENRTRASDGKFSSINYWTTIQSTTLSPMLTKPLEMKGNAHWVSLEYEN
jgi:hypothetical protein